MTAIRRELAAAVAAVALVGLVGPAVPAAAVLLGPRQPATTTATAELRTSCPRCPAPIPCDGCWQPGLDER